MARAVRIDWEESERGRLLSCDEKGFDITEAGQTKPGDWSAGEDSGTRGVAVECVTIWNNTSGEGGWLDCN